jgi:hypothetical protein
VDALVVPADACGGAAVLALADRAQIIAVKDNTTTMQVSPSDLGIPAIMVNSYLEALGLLVAHKAGIDPVALQPRIPSLQEWDPLALH